MICVLPVAPKERNLILRLMRKSEERMLHRSLQIQARPWSWDIFNPNIDSLNPSTSLNSLFGKCCFNHFLPWIFPSMWINNFFVFFRLNLTEDQGRTEESWAPFHSLYSHWFFCFFYKLKYITVISMNITGDWQIILIILTVFILHYYFYYLSNFVG